MSHRRPDAIAVGRSQIVLILFLLYIHAIGCFVRGALPGQEVKCLGYNSWTWTIWGGIAYCFERVIREVRTVSGSLTSCRPHA